MAKPRMAFLLALATAALLSSSAFAASAPRHAPVVDLGRVSRAMTLTATVHLRMAAGFDAAVAARYDAHSPLFHNWMSPQQLAAFEPSAQTIVAARQALEGFGLTVTRVDESNIDVSGSSGAMKRAFGADVHQVLQNHETIFRNVAAVAPKGALASVVESVSGLSNQRAEPFLRRQLDVKGRPINVMIPQDSPLDAFTSACFGPSQKVVLKAGSTWASYTGFQYDLNAAEKPCGYTAAQVMKHYAIDGMHSAGLDGTGQTIVIVDAYGAPNTKNDANTFFSAMGIKPFKDTNFAIIAPLGQPTTTNSNWAGETMLDVEWAHAVAPGAKIILLITPDNMFTSFEGALNYVNKTQLGNVVSNSWGSPEFEVASQTAITFNSIAKKAAAQGISIQFSTGDSGDNEWGSPNGSASTPADAPWVTAVGGTSFGVPSGTTFRETGWGNYTAELGTTTDPLVPSEPFGFRWGGGGGASALFPKPTYQSDLSGSFRQTPDVAMLADPYTGGITVFPGGEFEPVGGTSLAAPLFSGVWALADQLAGFNNATHTYTPGSSLGLAAALIPQMVSSGAIVDVLPPDRSTPQASGKTIKDGTHASPTGFDLLGTGAIPGALTTISTDFGGGYGVISFNMDTSLTTTTGNDSTTGRGVPNGKKLMAFVKALTASKK
ncbi:MAG TPA: S53 family peptidase [Rhizomicrobium sp.]|jgi:subtilase family serine protease